MFMAITPEPIAGAPNNDSMPALTIYLLNILAKAAISQFCSEAGANPKAADPIGVILISVFSQPKYMWRGKTLIDILMAKLRVVCPVLFGVRGSDKTEEGRARLGWRKDENGKWISEQEHNDRMTGLGSGFASLCFRDFSKSSLVNPCPPYIYWQALAAITLTPKGETSSTQFVVLKAMIDNYVKMFLTFYGRIGLWALRAALNEFPLRADKDNVAASSCKVLAEKIQRDTGVQFIMEPKK
jgi:nucleoporin GLE1